MFPRRGGAPRGAFHGGASLRPVQRRPKPKAKPPTPTPIPEVVEEVDTENEISDVSSNNSDGGAAAAEQRMATPQPPASGRTMAGSSRRTNGFENNYGGAAAAEQRMTTSPPPASGRTMAGSSRRTNETENNYGGAAAADRRMGGPGKSYESSKRSKSSASTREPPPPWERSNMSARDRQASSRRMQSAQTSASSRRSLPVERSRSRSRSQDLPPGDVTKATDYGAVQEEEVVVTKPVAVKPVGTQFSDCFGGSCCGDAKQPGVELDDKPVLQWAKTPEAEEVTIMKPIDHVPDPPKPTTAPTLALREKDQESNVQIRKLTPPPKRFTFCEDEGLVYCLEAGCHVGAFLLPADHVDDAIRDLGRWVQSGISPLKNTETVIRCTHVMTWHKTRKYRVFVVVAKGNDTAKVVNRVLSEIRNNAAMIRDHAVTDFESRGYRMDTMDTRNQLQEKAKKEKIENNLFYRWLGRDALVVICTDNYCDPSTPVSKSQLPLVHVNSGKLLTDNELQHLNTMTMSASSSVSETAETDNSQNNVNNIHRNSLYLLPSFTKLTLPSTNMKTTMDNFKKFSNPFPRSSKLKFQPRRKTVKSVTIDLNLENTSLERPVVGKTKAVTLKKKAGQKKSINPGKYSADTSSKLPLKPINHNSQKKQGKTVAAKRKLPPSLTVTKCTPSATMDSLSSFMRNASPTVSISFLGDCSKDSMPFLLL